MPFGDIGIVAYWNAATNVPEIKSGKGVKGTTYQVGTAGTTSVDGIASWEVGDLITFGLDTWLKIPGNADTDFIAPGSGGLTETNQAKMQQILTDTDYSPGSLVAARGYTYGSMVQVRRGTTAALPCNPTSGDSLQNMAKWASANHYTEQGSELYLEIADGLHDVSTYIDIEKNHFLDMRAQGAPDLHAISSISFASLGGNLYTATIVLAVALNARVVVNWAMGAYLVAGDNSADALNGAFILASINGARTTITGTIRIDGVAPVNPTTITGGSLIVPRCCIRANSAGWDGSAREGFINALDGGRFHCYYVGFTYNGGHTSHDMIAGRGGDIRLMDYVVVAGCGAQVFRLDDTNFYASRFSFGCAGIGDGVITSQNTGRLRLSDGSMNGGSSGDLTVIDGVITSIGTVILAGGNRGYYSLDQNSGGYAAALTIVHCSTAIQMTDGNLTIDSSVISAIKRCTTPISFGIGEVNGPITLTGNTLPDPAQNQYINGGIWRTSSTPPVNKYWQPILSAAAVLDFGSIAAQTFADLTITVTGAALGDGVVIARQDAWPAQGVNYSGFVSAVNTVTIRGYNITTGAIDPAVATWRVGVYRLV